MEKNTNTNGIFFMGYCPPPDDEPEEEPPPDEEPPPEDSAWDVSEPIPVCEPEELFVSPNISEAFKYFSLKTVEVIFWSAIFK